jgi:hypothetical protein
MRALRGWLAAAVSCALLDAPGAAAQGTSPDIPAGPGAVVGRLVHGTRPEAAANIDVLLYALTPDGGGGLRQGVTDAEGRFRFDGVSNAPDVAYLVGARAGEIPFGSRFAFAPGETEHRIELTLQDPSADASDLVIGPVDLRIERGCTHLRFSHSHTVTNPGEQVVFVPEGARADAVPIFEVDMPAGVEGFESTLGREGVERDGTSVRFWGPLYPGTQQIEFGYGLAMETDRIEIGLPAGAPRLQVLAPEGVLDVASDALAPAPGLELEGQTYTAQRTDALAPGASLALALSLAERPLSPISTPRVELWLELDDAALEVSERMEVVVETPDGIAESQGEPLLCIPLPPGALELRFSNEMLEAGLRRDPSGDLAIHGPLPAGPTNLAVRYRLPATGAGSELERRFDRPLPLLSVLVADNGIVPDTTRLHRRRTVRSGDRMFLHFEAFAIEPLEAVHLGLRRTPPRGTGGRWASVGFALLAGLASLGYLANPLRADAPAVSEPDDFDPAALERDAFARALEDLDHDLETGKLAPEDHAVMRVELRTRAAAQLLPVAGAGEPSAEEPSVKAADTPESSSSTCARCGFGTEPEDHFCSGCAAALRCTSCGTPVRANGAFCSKCGREHSARVSEA